MNNLISKIESYPFERLRDLIKPQGFDEEINLSIGEPKHAANPETLNIVAQNQKLFSHYPPMSMVPELGDSYRNYLQDNFELSNIENDEIFLVGGTREGTFSAIQTMVDRELITKKPFVFMFFRNFTICTTHEWGYPNSSFKSFFLYFLCQAF